jgi:uncharacterized membrane protein YphA (DoxX/SURF4 family)
MLHKEFRHFCLKPKSRSSQLYHDSTYLLLKLHLASLLVASGLRTIQLLFVKQFQQTERLFSTLLLIPPPDSRGREINLSSSRVVQRDHLLLHRLPLKVHPRLGQLGRVQVGISIFIDNRLFAK